MPSPKRENEEVGKQVDAVAANYIDTGFQ